MTERIALNYDWQFTERFTEDFAAGGEAPDAKTVELPHSVVRTPFNYFDESVYQMVSGYRRLLHVPKAWEGKRVFLNIGGAAHYAEVFVNGLKLGEHRCGYTSFCLELTESLVPGSDAILAVRLDSRETLDQPPFGFVIDYMTYGGLYREVWLEVRDQSYIDDVFARARFGGALDCTVRVGGSPEGLSVRQRVAPRGGGAVMASGEFAIAGTTSETHLRCPTAMPWNVDKPVLYTLTTELMRGDAVLDRAKTTIGFRKAEWREEGFYLNGQKLKLVGLNRHQSYPYVGYAMPASVQRYDADILKNELGVNAVRTSHYPQSQDFINRCDELGLLVFTEIPGWQHIGGDAWKEQAVQNVKDMVLQYRNHPSVVLWGVRINESKDDDALYTRTNAAARALDPTRATGGVRYLENSSLLEDVYTYNDFSHDGATPGCRKKRSVTSDKRKAYLITEYAGHMFPTKPYDSEEHRLEQALRHANVLDAAAGEADIAGSFGWCMFDYNTHRDFGSGDRICYHGVTDMFRNPKPAAGVYAARRSEPLLEISSSMDIGEHPAGNLGRIFAFTNAEEVRVYKNGNLIRGFTHKDSPYRNLSAAPIEIDDFLGDRLAEEGFAPEQAAMVKELLNYASRFGFSHLPAALMAKAGLLRAKYRMSFEDAYALYRKYIGDWGGAATVYRFDAVSGGKVVCSVTKEPVEKLRLSVRASHTRLREARTYDAALLRITMTDQNGNVLPWWQGAVKLSTEGPIALIGPEEAVLRGGMGGTFVRTVGEGGKAALTLRAEGAEPVTVQFDIQAKGER